MIHDDMIIKFMAIKLLIRLHRKNLKTYLQKNYHKMKHVMKYRKKDIYLQKKDKELLMN